MSARPSRKYHAIQEVGSAPPSALAVVRPLETLPETEFSGVSPKAVSIVLSSMIFALQREVLNHEAWWLAMYGAEHEAERLGVPPEQFLKVKAQIERTRKARHASNPLSGMF